MAILSDMKPFRVFGELYFVGSSRVCSHIINTKNGLILIDTGYPDMYEEISESIKELGFNPENITAILHTHGHIDHYGCTERFVNISGAKTYISEIDNDIVNGKLDLSWANELDLPRVSPFDCDVLIKDGDVLDFGDVSIKCVLAPGHTPGTLVFFITMKNGDTTLTLAMHGGVGLLSMEKAVLERYSLPLEIRDIFREGLHALANEKVDIVLGTHPEQNDTKGKYEILNSGGSIIDGGEWQRFLLGREKLLDDMLAKENSN